jgi:hypothetical protein
MTIDYTNLRALAEEIAGGYEKLAFKCVDGDMQVGQVGNDGEFRGLIGIRISEWSGDLGDDYDLAAYIAAASPAVMLALLAECDTLAARVVELESAWHGESLNRKDGIIARQESEKDQLKARVAELELEAARLDWLETQIEAYWMRGYSRRE